LEVLTRWSYFLSLWQEKYFYVYDNCIANTNFEISKLNVMFPFLKTKLPSAKE